MILVEEPRDVAVVDKVGQRLEPVDVKGGFVRLELGLDLVHRRARRKDRAESKVQGVGERRIEALLLVGGNARHVSRVDLGHGHHGRADGLLEPLPKLDVDIHDRVHAEPVKPVGLDGAGDPVDQLVCHRLVRLIEVREVVQPAVENLLRKARVLRDLALFVVRLCSGEGSDHAIVLPNRPHMVHHQVQHNLHLPFVCSINQATKIVCASKVLVHLVQIPHPVPVVRVFRVDLRRDRRDPYRIKPHSLDVIQVCLRERKRAKRAVKPERSEGFVSQ